MPYEETVVKKPWGYEYLAYENEYVGLWYLHIEKGQSTSMHCHPKKNTGLVILNGIGKTSFLNDSFELKAPKKLMIRRGLFHSTSAISEDGIDIFEIEAPKMKHDLVRLSDNYGRSFKPYEGKSEEFKKPDDALWITDPLPGIIEKYEFCGKILTVQYCDDKNVSKLYEDDNNIIIILRGGFLSNSHDPIAQPGDVISGRTAKILSDNFRLAPSTLVIVI